MPLDQDLTVDLLPYTIHLLPSTFFFLPRPWLLHLPLPTPPLPPWPSSAPPRPDRTGLLHRPPALWRHRPHNLHQACLPPPAFVLSSVTESKPQIPTLNPNLAEDLVKGGEEACRRWKEVEEALNLWEEEEAKSGCKMEKNTQLSYTFPVLKGLLVQ
ncbi:hypothetical protein PAHAL_3G470000 [Panicum hallii]|jgi:hypothetical protein|uniref:Uncharacterized protein n=1 Tax=Panicum hallii TaxID=206008 RepID=A0A2S3HES0_9POAL|nr:hypothetical protein PAHAL_3G470000 [Panicum hallii]